MPEELDAIGREVNAKSTACVGEIKIRPWGRQTMRPSRELDRRCGIVEAMEFSAMLRGP